MEALLNMQGLLDLFTLTTLEIILGIDNVIFIAILVHTLPPVKRGTARFLGLSAALVMRVVMLFGASWIIKLTDPLFTLYNFGFSGRSILLITGGLFLIGKAALEIIELFDEDTLAGFGNERGKNHSYMNAIMQIAFIDLVLSFDSIITAVGMTNNLYIIITAILIAIVVMLISSKPIGDFIYKYPSIKVLALCFIALVGMMLLLNGFNIEFSKNYLYFAMFFSLLTEGINILLNKKKMGE